MENAENALPPSKKRAAGREISRDNPGLDDDDETSEQEAGTFKKASDEVMANRRIVKVRRNPASSTPSSNPFAAIHLVSPAAPPVEATDKPEGVKLDNIEDKAEVDEESEEGKGDVKTTENDKQSEAQIGESEAVAPSVESADKETVEADKTKEEDKEGEGAAKTENESGKDAEGEKTENEDEKANGGNDTAEKSTGNPSFSSFQQLSSNQNAFTGLAGTGFSGSAFSFGAISKDESVSGVKTDQPSFSFGHSVNGSVSLFGNSGASPVNKSEVSGFTPLQEVAVETGEENEKPVFTADSVLFEYSDGGWKERGKGEIKVNVSTTEVKKARLIMRSRGNYRLILNANLFPEMKLASMDKKGITFACVNSACETKDKLVTFALKFKDASMAEEFQAAVVEHKGGHPPSTLKTPENSPKASEV